MIYDLENSIGMLNILLIYRVMQEKRKCVSYFRKSN